MDSLAAAIFLYAVAVVLAYLEVQIEGPDGWAARLPTWRLTKPWFLKISGGKPLTGYHLSLTVFILLLWHWPVLWTEWTWKKEALVISQYLILVAVWDFLWFVVNPHYGLKRYNQVNVWWFKSWLFGVPVDYWYALFGSALVMLLAGKIGSWLPLVAVVVGLTVLSAAVGETIRAARTKKAG